MTYNVLAIGPHPDDVEIGAGGTIALLSAQGYKTAIVDLTRGLLSTRGSDVIRTQEAEDAKRILGTNGRIQMNFFEGSLLTNDWYLYDLVSLIRKTTPEIVLAPYWDDRHPDHGDSSKLITSACFWAGVKKFGSDLPTHRPKRILYYFLHREGPVSLIVNISDVFNKKMQAIKAFKSQFGALTEGEQATFISKPEFMQRIEARALNFGVQIGATYGEGFHCKDVNSVVDLMQWVKIQGVTG